MRKVVIGLLVLISLVSCGSGGNYEQRVKSLLNDLDVSHERYDYVAIVNLDACSNCHGIVDDFLFRNKDSEELVVILTSHSKKKIDQRDPSFDTLKIVKDIEGISIYEYNILDLKPVIVYLSDDFRFEEHKLFEFAQKIFP